jgi:small subunit ribosomal protein S6
MEKNTNYELLFIVHPDLENSIENVLDKFRSHIEKRGAKITYEENWGKRKLAYEIKKCDVGIYVLWFIGAPNSALAKIEKDIRLSEEIIRYIIVKLEEKSTKKTERKTEKVAKKSTEEVKEPQVKESEKARMKKIDEKLDQLLKEEIPK